MLCRHMGSPVEIDRKRPDLLPLVLLAIFTIGFFFPVLFLGRAPAMNSLKKVDPWREARIDAGDGTVEYRPDGLPVYTWDTTDGFADDLNRQFIPWGLYCQERLRSGEWPLWNPHLASGQPMFANHQTGIANPLILACYLLFPGIDAFTAIFFCIFLLAGWGMYAYLRILGLGRWPALLSAATYQFMLGYIPILDTLIVEKALFPFLLYTIERLVRAPAGKGGMWALLSVVLLALVQTSCHVQEAVFISYLIGPYILFIAGDGKAFLKGQAWRTIGRRLILAVGIYIPALVVGLIQNLPTLEFYMLSTRMTGFEEQVIEATYLESSLSWIQSLMIAFPRLFGDYLAGGQPLEHYLLNYGYVGIVTLLAALCAFRAGGTKRQVWFWQITALIFFISIISNWWYFNVLCSLPLFRVSLQKPFSPLFFSLVVLAGYGYRFLLNPHPTGTPGNRWLGYTSITIFATAIGLGGLLLYATLAPGRLFNAEHTYVFGQMGIGAGFCALALLAVGLFWRYANRDPAPDRAGIDRARGIAAMGILLVILLDLWPVKAHFNPFVKTEELFPRTDTTDLLISRLDWEPGDPDGPYRFGRSWKEALPPNTGMMYGLDDFGGYDSNLVGTYAELLTAVDRSLLVGVHYIETPRYRTSFSEPLWNMLGVKYVIAHPGHLGQFEPTDRWRHLYLGETLVLENMDVLPRMHLVDVNRLIVTTNSEDSLRYAAEVDPYLDGVVQFQGDELPCVNQADPLIFSTPPGDVIITEYLPEKVTATVNTDRTALLCFFDTWFPGWEVTVDGEPAELQKVNYAFKGVYVVPGEHEVIFSYRPKMMTWGLIGTLIGLILTIVIMKPLSHLCGVRE